MRSKSEERRIQIMRVAADTFSELGVENTTMSEIVARMGGSKATIYNYFPSKADLVQAVLARESELELRQAFMALDPALPAGDTLHRFGRNYLLHLLSPGMLSVRAPHAASNTATPRFSNCQVNGTTNQLLQR